MSDFCENCNPHSSYHTTVVGEYLVDIWFAEICQMTLVCFWKSIHAFKKHTSFVWIYSQLQIHTMLYVLWWDGKYLEIFQVTEVTWLTRWRMMKSFLFECRLTSFIIHTIIIIIIINTYFKNALKTTRNHNAPNRKILKAAKNIYRAAEVEQITLHTQ